MVLELARPSEARCFPPAGDFFEAVLLSCRKLELTRKFMGLYGHHF